MSIYSTRKSENQKNGRSGALGPASASPWRAKRGGLLPKLSTFLSQLKGDPLEKKQIFEKSHNAEKLKGGPFGIFKHPFCCKISKKLKGDPLERKKLEKSLTMPKNWKGDPLGFFNIHSVAKHQKLKGGTFFIFGKKSHNAEKNWKGGPFGIFQHPFCRKTAKKLKGGPFEEKNFRKKVSQCRKKLKGEKMVENFEKFQFFNNVHQSRD